MAFASSREGAHCPTWGSMNTQLDRALSLSVGITQGDHESGIGPNPIKNPSNCQETNPFVLGGGNPHTVWLGHKDLVFGEKKKHGKRRIRFKNA